MTVADAVPPELSLTRYVKVSVPENPGCGEYVTVPSALTVVAPALPDVALSSVREPPSGSVSFPRTTTVTGVLSNVVALSTTATGAL